MNHQSRIQTKSNHIGIHKRTGAQQKHRQTCEDSSQARITLLNPNNGTITTVREEMKHAIETNPQIRFIF